MALVDVELKIKRYIPEQDTKPHWETYEVRVEDTDRVVDALHEVKWHHDGTLSFRRSCVHGVCGSDAMVINGSNALACVLLVKDVGNKITIEPIRGLPVIKDLVVDMEPFFDQYKSVLPYMINSTDPGYEERKQSPEDRSASTTPPSASCARPVRRRARSTGATTPTWARRRSSTPTASSSIPATRPAPTVSTSSTSAPACGAAAPPSVAPRPARVTSRSPRPSKR